MPKKLDYEHPLGMVRKAIHAKYPLTQAKLAELVGCAKETIQKIETGNLKLSVSLAERIDNVIGSDLSKWVAPGNMDKPFNFKKELLIKNFEYKRQHEAISQNSSPPGSATYNINDEVFEELYGKNYWEKDIPSKIFESLEKCKKLSEEAFEKELLKIGYSKKSAKKGKSLVHNAIRMSDIYEIQLAWLQKLFFEAKKKEVEFPLLWSFQKWIDKASKEFKIK